MANVYRIFEGNYANLDAFEASESGSYAADLFDNSPVDLSIVKDLESNGDVIIKVVFANQEDRVAFAQYARTKNMDPEVCGIGHRSFPGRTFDI